MSSSIGRVPLRTSFLPSPPHDVRHYRVGSPEWTGSLRLRPSGRYRGREPFRRFPATVRRAGLSRFVTWRSRMLYEDLESEGAAIFPDGAVGVPRQGGARAIRPIHRPGAARGATTAQREGRVTLAP